MNVASGRGKLYGALKLARIRWDTIEEGWRDPVRHDFEEQVWLPLDEQAAAALRGIDRLEQVLIQMRHDCEGAASVL
jgi:hypothetical protein